MANEKGTARDASLNRMGFRVLRFWNNDVMQNFEVVLNIVLQNLQITTPLPGPLPQGERGDNKLNLNDSNGTN